MKKLLTLLSCALLPCFGFAAALTGDNLTLVQAATDLTTAGGGNPTSSTSGVTPATPAAGQGYIQLTELQFFNAFGESSTYTIEKVVSDGGDFTMSANFAESGESITITATANTAENYAFSHWEVTNGTVADELAASTTFTPTATDATIKAVFIKSASQITVL